MPSEPALEAGVLVYQSPEAVAVFANPDALEAAVSALEIGGFDRATISVLDAVDKVRDRIGRLYEAVREIQDDPLVPRAAFISRGSRLEGAAAAVVAPFYLGGLTGAAAIVASGGALAAAIAGTILASAAGAGLGALLVYAVARHHAARIADQLAHGGVVLWVSVRTETEPRARSTSCADPAGPTCISISSERPGARRIDRCLRHGWIRSWNPNRARGTGKSVCATDAPANQAKPAR